MITQENFTYAVRNLWNRKIRSLLTITSIFLGIATIFIFISFGWGLFYYINQLSSEMGVDKIIVQAKGIGAPGLDESFKLTDKDLKAFDSTRGIVQTGAVSFSTVKISKNRKISYQFLIGVPTDNKDEFNFIMEFFTTKILKGRNLEKGDIDKVVLGYSYSVPNKIFEKEYRIGDKITINDFDLEIIGFFKELGNPQDDANIYVSMDTYKKIKGINELNYAMLIGRVDKVDEISSIIERVEKELRNSRNEQKGKETFFVSSSEDLIATFQTSLNIVVGFVILIAFISVLVSAINTSNTMFTSILERTKEIGILKAIGAKNSEILVIFLLESAILGFVAGVIGVIVGWALSVVGGSVLKSIGWGFLQPYSPPILFIGCILFATLVGTVSGILPAYNASKKNPVDSLRYE